MSYAPAMRAPAAISPTAPQISFGCAFDSSSTSAMSVTSVVSRRSVDHIGTLRYCSAAMPETTLTDQTVASRTQPLRSGRNG